MGESQESASVRVSPISGTPPPVEHQYKPGGAGGPGRPRASSIRAALDRRLSRDPDADGLGREAGEFSDLLTQAVRAGDKDKAWCIAQLIAEVEGKPKEHVEHSGATVRTVIVQPGVAEAPKMPIAEGTE